MFVSAITGILYFDLIVGCSLWTGCNAYRSTHRHHPTHRRPTGNQPADRYDHAERITQQSFFDTGGVVEYRLRKFKRSNHHIFGISLASQASPSKIRLPPASSS